MRLTEQLVLTSFAGLCSYSLDTNRKTPKLPCYTVINLRTIKKNVQSTIEFRFILLNRRDATSGAVRQTKVVTRVEMRLNFQKR